MTYISLFRESLGRMKSLKNLVFLGMAAAVSVALGFFSLDIGDILKINFVTISNQLVYYFFGPGVGMIFGGVVDILKYLVKPTGPFFPGFTVDAMIGGLIYGSLLYKKKLTFKRVLFTEILVSLTVNCLLGTYWLSVLYGKGFFAILPLRLIKNLCQSPVNAAIFFCLMKALKGFRPDA